jgi:hypothetical protein
MRNLLQPPPTITEGIVAAYDPNRGYGYSGKTMGRSLQRSVPATAARSPMRQADNHQQFRLSSATQCRKIGD